MPRVRNWKSRASYRGIQQSEAILAEFATVNNHLLRSYKQAPPSCQPFSGPRYISQLQNASVSFERVYARDN
jgi:hypothetical protein